MSPTNDLYDTDFYQWTQEQAALLREGKLHELDLANLGGGVKMPFILPIRRPGGCVPGWSAPARAGSCARRQ